MNHEPAIRPGCDPSLRGPARVWISEPALACLCEALIGSAPAAATGTEPIRPEDLERTAAFAREQISALPRGFLVLHNLGMILFLQYIRLTRFAAFESLAPLQRTAIVERWAYGNVTLTRALFRVMRISVLLAYYELPEVKTRLACSHAEPRVSEP